MKASYMQKISATVLLLFALIVGINNVALCVGRNVINLPIVKAKTQFLELYQAQWKLFGLDDKLNKIIDEAIDEHTKDLMWGTVGLQLGMNSDNIVDKIQEAAGFKFSPAYEKFIAELEEYWGDILRKDILEFYEETNARMLF